MVSRFAMGALMTLVVGGALQTHAQAGGFSWGEADTDILFEKGDVAARGGVVYVNPNRRYNTVNGVVGTDGDFSGSFTIPSFAIMGRISDALACAFTYTQPFGGRSEYGAQAQRADMIAEAPASYNYYRSKKFDTNEFGATCDVSFATGPGRLHFLGGGFTQDFSYVADSYYGTLRLDDDQALGYRLGVAYDIPEYAFRTELMYRSEVEQKVSGTFQPAGPLVGLVGAGILDAQGAGSLPQSVKLSLQSGIAPDWLAYGSVEWTDWSVLKTLDYNIQLLGPQHDEYNWQDGWTIQAGIAHKFTDMLAGTVNIRWDKGVGTGSDIMTDTWTLGTGALITMGPGQLTLGAAVSYLTSGSQSLAKGANFNATANGDWAYALAANYQIKF
ncbi:MAG: outer membrane protein transport protein [Neorhizobium sp.]|nr:outer membrane protein transport protein [Neorhizobium sp.]